MSKFVRMSLAMAACAMLFAVSSVDAQQAAKQEKRAAKRAAENQLFKFPAEITLTAEQQTKLKAITDEYAPKLAALNAKQSEILTPEQRAARAEVTKANREAKKSGKEAQEAVAAALKLTDEQKTKFDAAQKELAALRKEVETKKRDLLTEEQKAKLPQRKGKRAKAQ